MDGKSEERRFPWLTVDRAGITAALVAAIGLGYQNSETMGRLDEKIQSHLTYHPNVELQRQIDQLRERVRDLEQWRLERVRQPEE